MGTTLYIATNKPLKISRAILSYLKLESYFTGIWAPDLIQPSFPSKDEMLRHLLETCQIAKDTWYVGDSPEDATAALANNLQFVWAAYGYGLSKPTHEKSFYTIQTLAELQSLLR
jgi:phosphoglycolate phosphatase